MKYLISIIFALCISCTSSNSPPRLNSENLSDEELEQGFNSLMDIERYWQQSKEHYTLKNGIISGNNGRLMSKMEYADFHLKFDFKLAPATNNGLAIRSPLIGNKIELQILDNQHPSYKDLKDYQYHGSLYNYVPAKRGFLKKTGLWNSQEVICKGSEVKVVLNGTLIMQADLSKVKAISKESSSMPYINKMTKGHIGVLGHDSPIEIKNIKIKEL